MDTLTHALSGALLARATASKEAPPRSIPRRVAAGFFACATPDLDIVYALGGPATYLLNHRGATHSLLLLPLWALACSWLLAKLLREPGGWRPLYGVTAMALGLHVAGDLITGYGTMIFWPLTLWRPGLATTFIIDLWFSGIIVAGLVSSSLWRKTRIPAVASLAVLLGYVAFQAVLRGQALQIGEEYAKSRALAGAQVAAFPRPVSPFNWTVLVSDEDGHRVAHVNLIRQEARTYRPGDGFIARVDAPYLPVAQASWTTYPRYGAQDPALVKEAWNAAPLAFFRWFAEMPAMAARSRDPDCVWFTDLRFLTPGRGDRAFVYGVCRAGPGEPWKLQAPPD